MTALELFQNGRLRDAIQVQEGFVRDQPTNADAGLLLCELLLFDGSLDAARRHLASMPSDLFGTTDYLDGYCLLLDAEAKRQRLFLDVEPRFLHDPPEHFSWRLEALSLLRQHRPLDAFLELDQADERTPWVTGHIDGREFDGARDSDDLLSSVLEVIVEDQYVWFPFEQIRRLRLGPREMLRDRLFVPASLAATSGEEWAVYLPALYPGSHAHPDDDVRAGQATDWFTEEDGPTRGGGLRVFTFGQEELTFFDFTQWEK